MNHEVDEVELDEDQGDWSYRWPQWAVYASGVLVLIGLCIASYLTFEHFTGSETLACSGNGVINCLKVTTSAQSYFLGIPVSVLGLLFFAACAAVFNPWGWRVQKPLFYYGRLALVISGMVFVLWLIYAELILIGSICLWCTGVHVVTFLLFVVTLQAWNSREVVFSGDAEEG